MVQIRQLRTSRRGDTVRTSIGCVGSRSGGEKSPRAGGHRYIEGKFRVRNDSRGRRSLRAFRRAFVAAKQLAKGTGGKVRLVHIRESFASKPGPVPDFSDADAILVEESLAELTAEGIEATGVVYDSHHSRRVASAILEEATDCGASLIVIGSRGLSDLVGMVVGSTTHKVLHLGTLPVLVVR